MKALLTIGDGKIQENAILVGSAIDKIFDSAFRNHMDQETVRHALDTLSKSCSVSNVSISNNVFSANDKKD